MTGQQAGAVTVEEVGPEAADDVVGIIHAGFGARERLDPPSTATDETVESVAAVLKEHGGLLARSGSWPAGALLLEPCGRLLGLRRVAVHPDTQGMGVAGALVGSAERVAADRGYDGITIIARAELPGTVAFWRHLGYDESERSGPMITMVKALPVEATAESAEDARALGERLARVLRAGDVVLLTGELGAGKTTFAQGVGAGLRVRGDVTSPTFVISRVHPSLVGGPPLVHVDAYRLGGVAELDDLDLDTALDEAVTLVEWGSGVAEGLNETRLEVTLTRARANEPAGTEGADPRHLRFTPVGARWIGAGLREALA